METSWKPHETLVFTRIYRIYPYFPVLPLCSHTPRFSFGLPETAVRAFWHTSPVVAGGYQGGYSGWVPGWVYRGVLPSR